jgi:hypothetical protein
VNPERRATIRGHLVEQFRWHDCPICYVDAHRVLGSFDHAVADLRVADLAMTIDIDKSRIIS